MQMTTKTTAGPSLLDQPFEIGGEISVTGKWIPLRPGALFRKSPDQDDLLTEWEDIYAAACADSGVLHTEINLAVSENALIVHHVFRDADALLSYFGSTETEHAKALMSVARPELHLVRGIDVSKKVRKALEGMRVPAAFGTYSFGFVRDYAAPDPVSAIQVTAKWTCKLDTPAGGPDELTSIWRQVGADAFDLEEGLLRFEAYAVEGEDALIIHETFADTDVLKFHLTKGTANIYKKHLDKIAAPENYYFRGPVAWMIRTYSKFMHLPATFSSFGSHHTKPGGSKSAGTV
jgi:quinol monooxygenase YgiN